jgi:hypothetical protein
MSRTDRALRVAAVVAVWAITVGLVVLVLWLIAAGVRAGYCAIMVAENVRSPWCYAYQYLNAATQTW